MKRSYHTITSALRELGTGRFLAALMCLFLVGVQPSAFAQSGPDTNPEGGVGTGTGDEDDDGDDGDGLAGDETVGTLPSRASEDPPPGGPISIPGVPNHGNGVFFSPDGALSIVGPSAEILDLLSRTRGSGPITIGLDSGGGARATLMGDFRLRLRPEVFAQLHLDATLTSRLGVTTRVTWHHRSTLLQLGSGASLVLPLTQIASSSSGVGSALADSPLVIDSINLWGETTRLTLALERGFVVLTQTRH